MSVADWSLAERAAVSAWCADYTYSDMCYRRVRIGLWEQFRALPVRALPTREAMVLRDTLLSRSLAEVSQAQVHACNMIVDSLWASLTRCEVQPSGDAGGQGPQ